MKVMESGNNKGVLEYDGEEWNLIPPTDGSPVYSLAAAENGRIFFGSVNEFGYLLPDSIGQLEYFLLSDLLPEEYCGFSEIWETHVIDGGVIFQSFHNIFIWKNDSISVIHSEDEINELFHVGDDLFISYRDSLGYLDGNKILPIGRGEISDSTRI